MCCSGGSRSLNFICDRKIKTDNAVLKKPNAIRLGGFGDQRSERRIQE